VGADYLLAKRHGDLVFVSGHGPLKLDRIGVVEGGDVRVCALVDVMLLELLAARQADRDRPGLVV
jgi:hypothetical protein